MIDLIRQFIGLLMVSLKLVELASERIDRRTGHSSEDMRKRYMRAAQSLAELRMEVFPDLTGAVPELAESARRLAKGLAKSAVSESQAEQSGMNTSARNQRECEGGDLNPYASYGASTSS